jgi:hypothetical protein
VLLEPVERRSGSGGIAIEAQRELRLGELDRELEQNRPAPLATLRPRAIVSMASSRRSASMSSCGATQVSSPTEVTRRARTSS